MLKNKNTKSVCMYFQVHQPYRLSNLSHFDIARTDINYFNGPLNFANKDIFEKVALKCYLPTNKILLELLNKHPEFKISFSLSGIFLEQCMEFGEIGKKVLDTFKELAKTKKVEFLSETYHHSLAYFYSKKEFAEQILEHRDLIYKLFKKKTNIFRHTELIYNNEIANFIRNMGFKGILAEGWDPVLNGKSPNYVYEPLNCKIHKSDEKLANKYAIQKRKPKNFKLLLKNYKLSDDIAFRFSQKSWEGFPLTADKYAAWVDATEGETVNLFMDFETFGEHQWEDTGIHEFLKHLPEEILKRNIGFKTPSETIKKFKSHGEIDIHHPLSWADTERDLSAWFGNDLQESAIASVFEIEPLINKKRSKELKNKWRKLQTSDHFYYMCTKYFNDGDVHKYFSPYESPYDAYINYMNVLTDLKHNLGYNA
jgi:alpha-amylase